MGAGRELVSRAAHPVTGGEQAVDRGHPVVAPIPLGRCQVCGSAHPHTGVGGVGADKIGLGCHHLGRLLFREDILAGPDQRLGDGHIQEVFPGLGLQLFHLLLVGLGVILVLFGQGGDGPFSPDGHRTPAPHGFQHHLVVTQRRGHWLGCVIWCPRLEYVQIVDVLLIESVGGRRLEEQEPGAHRAVAILEPGGDETTFHLGQLSAHLGHHGVVGAGVPGRIPGTTQSLAHGARSEDVHGATAHAADGLGLDEIDLVLADAEACGPGDPVGVIGVGEQLDDEQTLNDVVHAQGVLGGLGHDYLV